MTSDQMAYLSRTGISRCNLFIFVVQKAAPKVAIAQQVHSSGNPVLSISFGTCKCPGCNYFKRMEKGILI